MAREALLDPKQPVPGRYTALTVLPIDDPDDNRWVSDGFIFKPEICASGGVLAVDCFGNSAEMSDFAQPSQVDGSAFAIYAQDECSTFGFQARDYAARARRQLEADQSFHFAKELWTGAATGSPSSITTPKNRQLASSAATTITSAAITPAAAVACIENSAMNCGHNRRVMIHMRPQVLAALAVNGSVRREGNLWLTPSDNIIVSDAGYTGSAPGAPGTPGTTSQYIYATSYITVRLSPIEIIGGPDATGIDRSVNTVTTWALRHAMFQWDECCHFAAQVDLAVCAGS